MCQSPRQGEVIMSAKPVISMFDELGTMPPIRHQYAVSTNKGFLCGAMVLAVLDMHNGAYATKQHAVDKANLHMDENPDCGVIRVLRIDETIIRVI